MLTTSNTGEWLLGEAAEVFQLIAWRVRFDVTGDADVAESGAHTLIQAEEALEVEVAFEVEAEFVNLDAARGRVVGHAYGETRGQRVQHRFGWG